MGQGSVPRGSSGLWLWFVFVPRRRRALCDPLPLCYVTSHVFVSFWSLFHSIHRLHTRLHSYPSLILGTAFPYISHFIMVSFVLGTGFPHRLPFSPEVLENFDVQLCATRIFIRYPNLYSISTTRSLPRISLDFELSFYRAFMVIHMVSM